TPTSIIEPKLSSKEDDLIIALKSTPKVIGIIKDIQPSTYLVGFKLLNGTTEENLYEAASSLMKNNKCDLVVANDLIDIKAGNHKAMIIDKAGKKDYAESKTDIAQKLIERIWGDMSLDALIRGIYVN
ncbi:MAG TPA: hypothetical protein DEG71_09245, partial [Clostridiales bacterium]|nr:hypothetical protein [Clostridiales bacterium]